MLDIDHFKSINDTHGHDIGDAVLLEFASLIKEQLRSTEIFVRIGGEEFGITLPVSKEITVAICNRLLTTIRTHLFSEKNIQVTASMGITDSTFSNELDKLYKEADRLLYRAKNSGRNRCEFEPLP